MRFLALSLVLASSAAFACDGPQSQMMGNHMAMGYNGGQMMRLPTMVQRVSSSGLPTPDLPSGSRFTMPDGLTGWVLDPVTNLPGIPGIHVPGLQQRRQQEDLSPADIDAIREALKEETKFKRIGPELFTMEEANELSKKTGKPVLCWMGPHVFANAKARERSLALADTTIQAVMDSDGETRDAKGNPLPLHRVKFTDNGFYSKDSKVAFIPVAKLDKDSDKKILAFTRGGK